MSKGALTWFEIICSYRVEVMLLLESPIMMKSGLLSKAYEKKNLTRSQLVEGPKYESQTENNGKARSRGTLFGSPHLKGVEGRAGALG
jgi:hypothetical protein